MTTFILGLAKIYDDKISIHRGKLHSYLRLDRDYSDTRRVEISMFKYQVCPENYLIFPGAHQKQVRVICGGTPIPNKRQGSFADIPT